MIHIRILGILDFFPYMKMSFQKITVLDQLAMQSQNQGRYEEAEALYFQALAVRKTVFGEQHSGYATNLFNLAELYCNQGREVEAEPLYIKAIDIQREAFGEEDIDTSIIYSLAVLYEGQGRYEESEPLFRQAQSIDIKGLRVAA